MNLDIREPAVAQSYPTFWTEDTISAPTAVLLPHADDAYATFVLLCEEEFPEDLDIAADTD
jgi:hypothetical protein